MYAKYRTTLPPACYQYILSFPRHCLVPGTLPRYCLHIILMFNVPVSPTCYPYHEYTLITCLYQAYLLTTLLPHHSDIHFLSLFTLPCCTHVYSSNTACMSTTYYPYHTCVTYMPPTDRVGRRNVQQHMYIPEKSE